jgi:hypothetical protein
MQIAAALPLAAARKPLLRQRCRQQTLRVFAWGIPGLSCLCFLTPSFGQPVDVLPLPITSPAAVQPATIDPLSPSEKAALALKNSFGIKAVVNRALLTGINHWRDSPEEWPGNLEGYGMRMGSRMGRLAVRNAIQLGADVAFKTDPRYDRCDCNGVKLRSVHAMKRVFIARKDGGGEMISVSRLAGAYVTPMITDQWYPDRLNTWDHKLKSGTAFLAWRVANNLVKEFWPEIRRKFRKK